MGESLSTLANNIIIVRVAGLSMDEINGASTKRKNTSAIRTTPTPPFLKLGKKLKT